VIARSKHALLAHASEYVRAAAAFSRNARAYLALSALQNAGMGMLLTVFAIYVKTWGMSEAVVGGAEGALALAGGVIALVSAPLISVFGYRRLLIVACAAYAVARIGQALVPVTFAVLAFGALTGVGDGVMRAASTSFISENSEKAERTHLYTMDLVIRLGAAAVGSVLGGALASGLGLIMSDAEALRWTVIASGMLFAAAAIPGLLVREDLHPVRHALAAYRRTVTAFSSWGHLLRLAVPQMVIATGAGLIMPFLSLYLKHQLGATIGEVGLIQGGGEIAMGIAALGAPWLGRRFGLIKGTVITELLSLPLLASIPSIGWLPAAAGVLWVRAALMNMSWPLLNQYSMEGVPGPEKPLVAGGLGFAWAAGWLIGSVAGGQLMALSYTWPYYVTVVFYAAGAALTWRLLGSRDIHPDARVAV
jgi:MFS family permease